MQSIREAHHPSALRRLQGGDTGVQRPTTSGRHLPAVRADGNAEIEGALGGPAGRLRWHTAQGARISSQGASREELKSSTVLAKGQLSIGACRDLFFNL